MRDNVQAHVSRLVARNQALSHEMRALQEQFDMLKMQRDTIIGELTAAQASLQTYSLVLTDNQPPPPPAPQPTDTLAPAADQI